MAEVREVMITLQAQVAETAAKYTINKALDTKNMSSILDIHQCAA